MEIFDDYTIKELIADSVLISSNGICSCGGYLFKFEIKTAHFVSCSHLRSTGTDEHLLSTLAFILIKYKSKSAQLFADDMHYYLFDSDELIIHDLNDNSFNCHENFYDYAYNYNKKHGNFGDFKTLVEGLSNPPYEGFVMSKITRKR